MEKASGRDLAAFFDGWIYGSSVPVLGFTSTVTGSEARIRFEHRGAVDPDAGDGLDQLMPTGAARTWWWR